MSGGFFRGTSAEQDTRFSNKQAKLLKTQKFPPELDHVVDITKVKMDVINPWIAKRVTELLGFEDEVLINFINGLLEGKDINGKQIQIQLTGFMEKHTGKFMKELWSLLISAQNNASGVPQQFLDAKEEETRKKKEELDRIGNEMQKRREKEAEHVNSKMDGGLNNDYSASAAKDSIVGSDDEKEGGIKNGFGRNSRSSRSPQPANRHSSPHRGASRRYRDESLSPRGLRRSMSRSRSPVRRRSRSPRRPWRRHRSPRRRRLSRSPSLSPRRRRPSRSPSPRRGRRRSPPPASWRRRSRSPRRRHNLSPSPRRRRSISPRPNRSPSPVTRHRRSPSSSPSPPRRNLSPPPAVTRHRRSSPSSSPSPSPVTKHRRRSPSSSPSPPIRNRKRPSSSPPNQQHRSSPPQTHPSLSPPSPHLPQSPTDKERYRTSDAAHRGRGRDSARDMTSNRHKPLEEPSAAVPLSPIDEHKEDEELPKKHSDSKKRKSSRSETSGDDSESKEANKRRRKEEKKSRRDERRRRREERRRRKEEKRAHKRRSKDSETESSSSDKHENDDVSADVESEKKRVENELREKALQNIRAKKGISR